MPRKKKEETGEAKPLTRAQKTDAAKTVIKELLAVKPHKHNELLDAAAKRFTERHGDADTENANDVKGRIGSVLDAMIKNSDVSYEGGVYALKARLPLPPEAREQKRTEVKTEEKAEESKETKETAPTAPVEEKKTKKTTKKAKADDAETANKAAKKTTKKTTETSESKSDKLDKSEKSDEEKPAPKKRGRKPKAAAPVEPVESTETVEKAEQAEVTPVEQAATATPVEEKIEKTEEKKEEKQAPAPERSEEKAEVIHEPTAEKVEKTEAAEKPVVTAPLVVREKGELAKAAVMDMSFLLGGKAKPRHEEKHEEKREDKREERRDRGQERREENRKPQARAEKPQPENKGNAAESKPPVAPVEKKEDPTPKKNAERGEKRERPVRKGQEKTLSADEKLKESFLKKIRTLGGDYFEYYSVYLLERYSMKNGRRLEGMRVCGGGNDGGIDGEIELTDKFGFRETIYVQAKNWDPEKGKEENWVVGETLLQQFIGACECRKAKEGKQHCRGIFVTTSRFTPDAKRILDAMADKIVGYDGADLYEAAKECSFGLTNENGAWKLDEKLLSGEKAFFNML